MFEMLSDPELPDDALSPQELAAWVASDPGGPDPDVEMSAEVIRQAPSPATVAAMVRLLVDTDGVARPVADLSDAQVIDLVVAAEKAARWMTSVRSSVVSELQSRWTGFTPDQISAQPEDRAKRMKRVYHRETQTPLRAHVGRRSGSEERIDATALAVAFVVTEVALAAGTSEYQAGEWLRVGSALVRGEYPLIADALKTGVLDWGKARLVAGMLSDRSPSVAAAAEAVLLPEITLPDPANRTHPAVKARLTQILMELDPQTEAATQDHERDDRHVRTRALSNTMGELVAVLPLDQVAKIAARLDAAARKARRDRDPRTPDQVRADTLAALLIGGQLRPRTTTKPTATTSQTEPEPAAETEAPASEATAARAPKTPAGPAPAPPAEPGEPVPPSTGLPPGSAFGPAPRPPLDDCDFRESDDPLLFADPDGFGISELDEYGESGIRIYLYMSIETLIGLRDDPAYLDKYGPVPAALARDLATHGTFRCAAVDDTHGTILGLGHGTHRDGYVAGQRLQDLQRALWRHRCSYPGCRTKTTPDTCDLDHVTPWPTGATCSCNTQPLCRRHHRMKTHGHIQLEPSTDPNDPPGSYHWRLPSGHRYTHRPEALTASITARIEAMTAHGRPVGTIYDDPDEPPPF